MARSMRQALMGEAQIGTLDNPGSASPLGPTLSMRTGAFLHPLLQAAKDKFPKHNPRGRWLGEMLLGDSPQRTGRVAEGIPDQYFHFNRGSGSNVSPELVDLAGALPIASTLKLAKAAAVPAAMATGAGLLGRAVKSKNYAPASMDDMGAALLGQSMQTPGRLDNLMVNNSGPSTAISFDKPDQMGFRSVVSDVVNLDSFPNSGTAEQIEAALGQKGGLSNQVRDQIGNLRIDKEELKFLGITDLLDEAKRTGQPVTRKQLQNSIRLNRDTLNLTEDELLDIEPNYRRFGNTELIPFEDAEGVDYINERIGEDLAENPYYADQLAKNPDAEDEIRQKIYNQLEANYNEDPVKRIRLEDADIYAIGNDGMGWTIRMGGDDWGNSATLMSSGRFENAGLSRLAPMDFRSEGEARLQLEGQGQPSDLDWITDHIHNPGFGGAAQFRNYLAEDYLQGNIGDVTNYREFVVRLPEKAGGDIGSHFGDDVAYHMRVSDRDLYNENYNTDGGKLTEKALYVDEIQSDYAQAGAGRKLQLKPEEKAILNKLGMDKKELNLALSNFDTDEAIEANNNLLEKLSAAEHLEEFQHPRVLFLVDQLQQELAKSTARNRPHAENSRVKEQPLVAGKEKWVQHAIKNLITRMVNEDKDRLIFTNGKNQAEHWNEEGLEYFYDTKVRKEIADVLKGIDKDAIEIIDGGKVSTRGKLTEKALQHVSIKNTQKIKDFIKGVGDKPKGFGAYSAAPVAVGAGGLLNADNDDEAMQQALLRN